jgi:hypothetical protein
LQIDPVCPTARLDETTTSNNKQTYRGASVATPDKVENLLSKIKPTPGSNEVDLNAFVGAAVLGRANTAFAALTFVVIQVVVFGFLFVRPLVEAVTGIDIASNYLS